MFKVIFSIDNYMAMPLYVKKILSKGEKIKCSARFIFLLTDEMFDELLAVDRFKKCISCEVEWNESR